MKYKIFYHKELTSLIATAGNISIKIKNNKHFAKYKIGKIYPFKNGYAFRLLFEGGK